MTIPQHILDLAGRLRTQDDRSTRWPMFCVQRHVLVYGVDEGLADDRSWVRRCEVVSRDWFAALDLAQYAKAQEATIEGDTYKMSEFQRYGIKETWETVMVCFTEKGAQDYIDANGHNLRSSGHAAPRIYVESFSRCREMIDLRQWLMSLAGNAQ